MELKLIGTVITITACSAIGYLKAGDLEERKKQLLELKRILSMMQDEIRYAATPIPEMLTLFSEKAKVPFSDFFSRVQKQLEESNEFQDIWYREAEELGKQSSLNCEDIEELKQLGSELGCLDITSQIHRILYYTERLEEKLQIITEENRQKTRLYRLSGVMAGLFFSILLL